MQLVINTFGASLHRKGELFEIKIKGKKVELPAVKIKSILITTSVHFSSDVILLAIEHNIDIVLLDKYGKPFGRFWNGKMGSTAAIRRAQLEAENTDKGLDIILNWTISKLKNQATFLKDLLKRRQTQQDFFKQYIEQINSSIEKLLTIGQGSLEEKRQTIMGLEGVAAAAYWHVLGTLPPSNFQFNKRTRNPATDPFNAMLNYAYGVLYSKVEKALIIAGLDPFIGFLHTDNYNKKSLVFDLIEPFRIFADRVVLKLFTGRQCKVDFFQQLSSSAIILQKDAKQLLLSNLNEYLDQRINYHIKSSKTNKTRQIKRLNTIQAEAHNLANSLLNKKTDKLPELIDIEDFIEGDSTI